MSSMQRELDVLETETYVVAGRREVVAARAPRRESPRFDRRAPGSRGIGGMHKRCNKRWGM